MKPPIVHFKFNAQNGEHICRVEYGWIGAERYFVDDELLLTQWSLFRSNATFVSHGVQIQVRNRVNLNQAVSEVNLDGQLVIPNLLVDYNVDMALRLRRWGARRRKPGEPNQWASAVAGWLIVFALLFVFFTWHGSQ